MPVSGIFMIKYADGSKDVFNEPAKPHAGTPIDLLTNAGVGDLYKSGSAQKKVAKALGVSGTMFTLAGIGLLITSAGTNVNLKSVGVALLGNGLISFIPAIILDSSGGRRMKKAIDICNSSIQPNHQSDVSMNFGVTRSGGIGFTLNF